MPAPTADTPPHPFIRTFLELTQLPTAAGHEDRVIRWIEQWVAARPHLRLTRDTGGNLVVSHADAPSLTQPINPDSPPLFITAHLDHPAFVVERIVSPDSVELSFRGGVMDVFFDHAPILIHTADAAPLRATLTAISPSSSPAGKHYLADLTSENTASIRVGDVATWAMPAAELDADGLLHTHACDDLAAAAAAICAFDLIFPRAAAVQGEPEVELATAEQRGSAAVAATAEEAKTRATDFGTPKSVSSSLSSSPSPSSSPSSSSTSTSTSSPSPSSNTKPLNVHLLFTRAEEIGFIGAIAACKLGTMPRGSRVIALENSRAFPDSPIGGGPIVRVGDRLSIFTPWLTNACAKRAEQICGPASPTASQTNAQHAAAAAKKWQRKLMAGGACEASVFCAYGYDATCLCLPLGNYHNMPYLTELQAGIGPTIPGGYDPAKLGPPRAAREFVAASDYLGLIDLLVAIAHELPVTDPMMDRVEKLYADKAYVLG